ncbi:MAG: hypothetical protein M1820_000478 [Bogoriella megaspora]|nr:MAG: hypothetical protein M1820_000478 [Bogoriella megaspora]
MSQSSEPVDPDSSPNIVATCQQTRFHIQDDRRSPEVSVDKLNLSILPAGGKKPVKGKAKASARALEILVDADLKLKGGVHYGLLGRNGTGKSTLLRAMDTKIIPGVSLATRIALLQQTSADDGPPQGSNASMSTPDESLNKSALNYILQNDMVRNEIKADLNGELDSLGAPAITITSLTHSLRSMDAKFFLAEILTEIMESGPGYELILVEAQKDASIRSGARGAQSRKELLTMEKRAEDALQRIDSKEPPLDSEECQNEILRASEMITDLQATLDEHPLFDLEAKGRNILRALGFSNSTMEKPLKELSGGWKMRCMLASVLLQDADIMVLDEPTNFLDLLGILWLQKHLVDLRDTSPKTVVIVSHDRDFIDNVCESIILLKDKTLEYFNGNLTAYEEDLKSRRQNLVQMKESQDKQIARMEKTIAANMKAGKKQGDDNKLRQAVSRQKRIDDRMGVQVNEKGGRFKLSRDHAGFHETKRRAIEIPPEEKSVSLILPAAPDLRFPGPLVSLEQVTFAYSRKQEPVLKDINLSVYMGSRVGVMGLNGCGKSTLVKLITDITKPSKGTVSRHPRLKLGYFTQLAVEDLRAAGEAAPAETALTTLAAKVNDEIDEGDMRALLGSFGLVGRIASDIPIAKLSGGQLVGYIALSMSVFNIRTH